MAFWTKLKTTLARAWVDRSLRLKIADPEKISFYIKDESLEIKKLNVQNISCGGIGLLMSDFPNAGLGRIIEAELKIISSIQSNNSQKYATFKVRATIVHVSETTVGLSFSQVSPEFENALDQYFKVELLGTKLNLVDKKFLRPENNIYPIWLTDGRDNEIYILADKDEIISFHLCFLGHYIEGDKNTSVRVGQIAEPMSEDTFKKYKSTDVIEMTPRAQQSSLRLARDFVTNAKGVSPDILQALLSRLTNT